MSNKNEMSDTQLATRVSLRTITINIILTIIQMIIGIFSRSSAMISDAVHTASDIFSTVVVIIGVRMASKASDKEHPYGHERMEPIAAMVLAGILCATGIGIGYSAVLNIIHGGPDENPAKGLIGILALCTAAITVLVKEWMYWHTRAAAKKIGSGAMMADAWHHRSDSLSSVGSFAGILGARLGFPVLDSLAGVIICLFIVKAAYDIFRAAVCKMTDTACDDETICQIREIVLEHDGVLGIDDLKTRLFGNKIYVDLELSLDGSSTLTQAHDIGECIHVEIEARISMVKHCMIHINPGEKCP
ncbi:MAG: cation diffusion facilitator family transporter [Oscillospiraceae bacterium]|nr:cation diffusion facilitator family transporter [Oscillospiraceae bacterium]